MPGVDGVGGLPCLLLPARSSPAPWGGGLYEACGHRSRSAVRGSGVSLRFSLSRGSRGLSSCHLVVSVVIAPRSACFVAPVVISLVPHVCRPLPSPFHVLRFRPLCPSCVCSSPVFSCGFLSPFSPLPRQDGAGRSLLASFVACPFADALVTSSCVPVFACPTGDRSCRPRSRSSSSSPLLVSRRRSHLVRVSPFFYKRWRGGCRFVICLLTPVLGCGFPYRAGGWTEGCCLLASRMADGIIGGGLRTAWALAWLLACFGWRRAMWCRRRVVFGLWCHCLYI